MKKDHTSFFKSLFLPHPAPLLVQLGLTLDLAFR